MKITPKELKQIIKEELEAVKEKVVKRGDKYAYVSKKGKTLGTHDTKAGAEKQATAIRISRNVGESSLNEDGHTDVPSAIRKLKTSMEDAMQILNALEAPKELTPAGKEMMEYVERIKSNYEGGEAGMPPSLAEVEKLVRSSDYEGLKNNITTLWNDLLKWHRKTGIRLQHAVTTSFNQLNTLTRKQTG